MKVDISLKETKLEEEKKTTYTLIGISLAFLFGGEESTSMVFDVRVELQVDAVFKGVVSLLSALTIFPNAAGLPLRKRKIFQHKICDYLTIINQFKYLSSNNSSTESNVNICIGKAWTIINK